MRNKKNIKIKLNNKQNKGKKSAPILSIYFIGIKGVGMTMLAQFLKSWGHEISGSDVSASFLTDKALVKSKIKVFSPFAASNIPHNLDLIVYSSAYDFNNNLELQAIQNDEQLKKIPLLSYAEAVADVFQQFSGLAVCGSHGKSTVSAWLAYVLWRANLEPNALIGSYVKQLAGTSLKGKSNILITEADEYQNKLKYFQPRAVILNDIDYDHPDFFPNQESYLQVFADFLQKIPQQGFLIFNADNEKSQKLAQNLKIKKITYALSEVKDLVPVDYVAHNLQIKNKRQIFKVNNLGNFKIKLGGEYNVRNALAVIAAAREYKVSWPKIKQYLEEFTGLDRRTERLGKYKDVLIIDDYAHHPTEVKASLQGIKEFYPQHKIITVFHPHTYTRTKVFFQEFVESFTLSDQLIILSIYGSARESKKTKQVSHQQLAQAIKRYNQKNNLKQIVVPLKDIESVSNYLYNYIKKLRIKHRKKTIILLLGAGDVFRVGQNLLTK